MDLLGRRMITSGSPPAMSRLLRPVLLGISKICARDDPRMSAPTSSTRRPDLRERHPELGGDLAGRDGGVGADDQDGLHIPAGGHRHQCRPQRADGLSRAPVRVRHDGQIWRWPRLAGVRPGLLAARGRSTASVGAPSLCSSCAESRIRSSKASRQKAATTPSIRPMSRPIARSTFRPSPDGASGGELRITLAAAVVVGRERRELIVGRAQLAVQLSEVGVQALPRGLRSSVVEPA